MVKGRKAMGEEEGEGPWGGERGRNRLLLLPLLLPPPMASHDRSIFLFSATRVERAAARAGRGRGGTRLEGQFFQERSVGGEGGKDEQSLRLSLL